MSFLTATLFILMHRSALSHERLAAAVEQNRIQLALLPPLGRVRLEVTDFGADPSVITVSDVAIANALAACNEIVTPTYACDVHFAAGIYSLLESTTVTCGNLTNVEFCLPVGPITLSGDGPYSSVIEPGAGASATIFAGQTTAPLQGLVIHDLGFDNYRGSTKSSAGVDIALPLVNGASLYRLHFQGAYDAISLGVNDAQPGMHTSNVYIDSITSDNGAHCFLDLNGGNSYTFVSHVYAEANNALNSEVLCIPHQVVRVGGGLAGNAFGVNNFFLSDSNFEGFARGIPIEAFEFSFYNAVFSNLYLDTAIGGPSIEIMAIPRLDGGSTNVSNIRVTNSLFNSSSTACITYGQVTNVRMTNVTCNGAEPDTVPTPIFSPIPTPTPSITPTPAPTCAKQGDAPRGEAYVLYGGSATPGDGSISLTITAPNFSSKTYTQVPQTGDSTVGDVVARLVNQINTDNTLIGWPACSPLIQIDSIGPLVPIRSFSYGSGTVSFSAAAMSPLTLVQPTSTGTYAFSPSDVLRIDGHAATPQQLSVTTSSFSGASAASGMHLFGGSNITLSNDRMNGEGAPTNMYALTLDPSGTYSSVLFNADDVSLNGTSPPLVYSTPISGVSLTNVPAASPPVPLPSATATPGCGTTISNPFPFPVEVIVNGSYNHINKDNAPSVWPTGAFATVTLRVGETFAIGCVAGGSEPTLTWFAQ
jgi:hypothetical protein